MNVVNLLFTLFFVGSIIWVLVDAPQRRLSRIWALWSLLLWIICFPMYLAKRGRIIKDGVQTFMWVMYGVNIFLFVVAIVAILGAH